MADLTRHEQFLNHIAHPDEPAPTPQTREEFLLKEIADNKGGGLPDYSEASEGDVLSIDSNGDPAWAPPSGGGNNIVIVPYEWSDAQNKWVTDALLSDAISAYQDGKLIVLDSGAGQFVANNVDIGAQSIRWVVLEGGMNEFIADWFLWSASGISYMEYYWNASTD